MVGRREAVTDEPDVSRAQEGALLVRGRVRLRVRLRVRVRVRVVRARARVRGRGRDRVRGTLLHGYRCVLVEDAKP